MSRKVTTFDVLMSCPDDIVQKGYLNTIEASVQLFNATVGDSNGVSIQTKHWSKNSFPESGGKPQDLLNHQIVDNCDATIALFGSRFGTPTDRFGSGTEEEIERMIESGKQVFMYFVEEPVDPASVDPEQLKRVQDFKKKYQEQGIFSVVKSKEQLEGELRTHLFYYFLKKILDPDDQNRETSNIVLSNENNEQTMPLQRFHLSNSDFVKNQLEKIKLSIIQENKKVIKKIENNEHAADWMPKSQFAWQSHSKPTAVSIDQDEQTVIKRFAEVNGIELNSEFFSVGNLSEIDYRAGSFFGSTYRLQGTEEEKTKYDNLIEIYNQIKQQDAFKVYFASLDELRYVNLLISNTGTTYDEDIEITLRTPEGTVVKADDLLVPGEDIIKQFTDEGVISNIFGLKETSKIAKYDFTSYQIPYTPGLSIPGYSETSAEKYEKASTKYYDLLDNLFEYDYFQEDGMDIVKLHLDYLKQHSAMWFPTKLFFKAGIKQIDYEITTKQNPEILKGQISIL
ncbi:hypothetical protein [Paucilactobacillus vaccinostercus]|nr:hypothetical protein [Paucilactobacillus vaccinostercus]